MREWEAEKRAGRPAPTKPGGQLALPSPSVSASYFTLVREMSSAYNHRLRLVHSARPLGIKPSARRFQTTVSTVRKWFRRYPQQGPRGLIEPSRAPPPQPGKTPLAVEPQVVVLRQQLPTFGARRLLREFDLPLSPRALDRIWRQHGLLHKPRRQYPRQQDRAHRKAAWRLFQQISAATKDLDDIPHSWPQAQAFDRPAVPYTARDVRSGLLFWAFPQRPSAAASAGFAARMQQPLQRCGVSRRDLVWQTDNGSEFVGRFDRQGHRTGFPAALGDRQHVRIPPAAHTFHSDVETVHRRVEDEVFDLASLSSRGDFLAKSFTYQLSFNLVRPNSHTQNLSPWQIIEQLQPRSPLQLCLLPPVFLDYYLKDSGGYDLPRLP